MDPKELPGDPLPPGWKWNIDHAGRVYYIHPRGDSTYADPRLPPGWAYEVLENGEYTFISPTGERTTRDPRLPAVLSPQPASAYPPPRPAPANPPIVLAQNTYYHTSNSSPPITRTILTDERGTLVNVSETRTYEDWAGQVRETVSYGPGGAAGTHVVLQGRDGNVTNIIIR